MKLIKLNIVDSTESVSINRDQIKYIYKNKDGTVTIHLLDGKHFNVSGKSLKQIEDESEAL